MKVGKSLSQAADDVKDMWSAPAFAKGYGASAAARFASGGGKASAERRRWV
jgi:hypothetical protein